MIWVFVRIAGFDGDCVERRLVVSALLFTLFAAIVSNSLTSFETGIVVPRLYHKFAMACGLPMEIGSQVQWCAVACGLPMDIGGQS